MDKVTVKFEGGAVVTGTREQVETIMRNMNIRAAGGYYLSESEGLTPMSEMHTKHLMNALLKIYTAWINNLRRFEKPGEFIQALREGPVDKDLYALLAELAKREKNYS